MITIRTELKNEILEAIRDTIPLIESYYNEEEYVFPLCECIQEYASSFDLLSDFHLEVDINRKICAMCPINDIDVEMLNLRSKNIAKFAKGSVIDTVKYIRHSFRRCTKDKIDKHYVLIKLLFEDVLELFEKEDDEEFHVIKLVDTNASIFIFNPILKEKVREIRNELIIEFELK